MENRLAIAQVQQLVSRCPYQSWLGLKVTGFDREYTVLELPWRDELMGSPEQRTVHGGVLAALIDAAGCYSIAANLGYTVPTVDMRIDYHRVARPGELVARGRAIKIGKLVAVAEVRITDSDNRLIASGKIVYRNKRNSS